MSKQSPRYVEIDVSEWRLSGEEKMGTKPKRWLMEPDTEAHWLMKDAREFNTAKDGSRYRVGYDWAERIACGVAGVLGLPAAEVELCVARKGEEYVYGTICRSVCERNTEELVHGDELLAEQGVSVARDRRSYTLEAIHRALEDCGPPTNALPHLSTWEVFVGYLVLDALIGNTDRHAANWTVVRSESGRFLAPTFDHASSLGFQLSDSERLERTSTKDHNRTPEAFADRAKTKFACKPHPIDAVAEARMLDGEDAAAHWLDQPHRIDDLVAPIRAIPEHRMSTPARGFAERVMRRNWARLTASDAR
ncbi:MAG: HipA domain-containing protein [bacterium]|nr:HipA domain-containing protein [bacterium]